MNARGAQRQAIMFAREWRRLGHEVELFAGEKATPYTFDALLEGLPPVRTTGEWEHYIRRGGTLPGNGFFRVRHTSRVLRGLARTIDREGFDVVNAHNHPAQWLARHLHRASLVWTCNEPPVWHYYPTPENRRKRPFQRWHDRRNAGHIDAITVLDRVMEAKTRAGYPNVPVHVTGSGCELPGPLPPEEAPPPAGAGPALEPDRFHVLSVLGALADQKRPLDAVEAVAKSGIAGATLHLVGAPAGDGAARTKARADALGVRLVHHAAVSEGYLLYLYRHADAALFLPENQPWGIFPLEALLAGVPAVVSNEVGALEPLQGMGAPYPWVAPVGDAAAAGAHLRRVQEDPKAARGTAERYTRHLQEHYSWRAAAGRVLETLRAAAR